MIWKDFEGFNAPLKELSGILNGLGSIFKDLNRILRGGGWKDFDVVRMVLTGCRGIWSGK